MNGKFIDRVIEAHESWYSQSYETSTGTKTSRYVGTVTNPETTRIVWTNPAASDLQRL